MQWFKSTVGFVKDVGQQISEDEVPSMSGAIAYFAVLSLPPLLALLVWLTGIFFPDHIIESLLTGEAADVLGEDTATQIGTMLREAQEVGAGSLLTQILGIGALVLGATGAFVQLQRSLNRAWGVAPDPDQGGIKTMVIKRLMSFGMVLMIVFLLAISLVLSAVIAALSDELGELIGGAGWLMVQIADIALPLFLFTLLFAAMFKVLPDARVTWRVVWVGAFVTSLLFIVGKFLIGMFLSRAEVGEAFGAAGSLVIILVWIFYTSLLLLVGAEFTQVWARRKGMRIEPDEGAIRIVKDQRKVRDEEPEDAALPESEDREAESEDGEGGHPYTQGRSPQPRAGIYPEPDTD